jgi:hypothetical protein
MGVLLWVFCFEINRKILHNLSHFHLRTFLSSSMQFKHSTFALLTAVHEFLPFCTLITRIAVKLVGYQLAYRDQGLGTHDVLSTPDGDTSSTFQGAPHP